MAVHFRPRMVVILSCQLESRYHLFYRPLFSLTCIPEDKIFRVEWGIGRSGWAILMELEAHLIIFNLLINSPQVSHFKKVCTVNSLISSPQVSRFKKVCIVNSSVKSIRMIATLRTWCNLGEVHVWFIYMDHRVDSTIWFAPNHPPKKKVYA